MVIAYILPQMTFQNTHSNRSKCDVISPNIDSDTLLLEQTIVKLIKLAMISHDDTAFILTNNFVFRILFVVIVIVVVIERYVIFNP